MRRGKLEKLTEGEIKVGVKIVRSNEFGRRNIRSWQPGGKYTKVKGT